MRTRQKWGGIILMLAVLLLVYAGPGHAGRGGRVFISPSIVVPFGPFWGPSWGAYPYPPVVAAPPPVYVQPTPPVAAAPPPQYWYYCDSAQAYHPYVQQCPGGWKLVTPTPH